MDSVPKSAGMPLDAWRRGPELASSGCGMPRRPLLAHRPPLERRSHAPSSPPGSCVDNPQWDHDYQAGDWHRLWKIDASPHYFLTSGILSALAPESILDVGCGERVLSSHINHLRFREYVGIDVSSTAVAAARRLADDPRVSYVHANAEQCRPSRSFDVVLFLESSYYFGSPSAVVAGLPGRLGARIRDRVHFR